MGLFKDCGCGCDGKIQEEKFITSIISGLTFFIIANPETFRIVRRVLGPGIATPTGCPSTTGLLVHSVVFFLVVWGMMNVNKKKSNACAKTVERQEGKKSVVAPPPPMVEAPDPLPEFSESQIELFDSGRNLTGSAVPSAGTLFD